MHARAPCEAVTGRGKDYKQPFVSFSKSSHRYKYPIAIEKGQLCLPFLASWGNTFLNNSVLGLVGTVLAITSGDIKNYAVKVTLS